MVIPDGSLWPVALVGLWRDYAVPGGIANMVLGVICDLAYPRAVASEMADRHGMTVVVFSPSPLMGAKPDFIADPVGRLALISAEIDVWVRSPAVLANIGCLLQTVRMAHPKVGGGCYYPEEESNNVV